MSTVKFEATPLPAHTKATSDAPRKKRKRAPAQGAADDCFTCSNRNIQCDRRRPYCSQCLEGGQDCAGYKTQLTWGVGVASRGKLRGLSLPVAGTTKKASEPTNTAAPKPRKRNAASNPASTASPTSSRPAPPLANNLQTASRHDGATVRVSGPKPSLSDNAATVDAHPLRPLATRNASSQQTSSRSVPIDSRAPPLSIYNMVHGASPVTGAFQQGTGSPSHYEKPQHIQVSPYPTPSPTGQHFQFYSPQHQIPLTPSSHSYQSLPESLLPPPTLYQPTSQGTPISHRSQQGYLDQSVYPPPSAASVTSDFSFSAMMPIATEDDVEEIGRDFNSDGALSDSLSVASSSFPIDIGFSFPLSGVSLVGKTPRMQYLIQYYAEVIAPVLVAFDGPTNPLRNQILSFAARSESLQHAISALSASNIRQRQESGALSTGKTPGARRSSYMHLSLTSEVRDGTPELTSQDQKREESLHKYAAVRSLNQQLADPRSRKDDSVLATLLMLCLFHICDSGIARFQTQFDGVKKLLTLRGNNSNGADGDTRWMTRIFGLFDSVAATVNDRDIRIDGQHVPQGDGDWPYETFTGIDSGLFKSISRLGRLNVLSQGKAVQSNPTIVSRPLPVPPVMNGQSPGDFTTFDGNGWMRVLSDEDVFNLKTATPSVQERFWREWREIRHDLQTWSFDHTRFRGGNSGEVYLTDDQRMDVCNISESFRYSSLLYTERLADPGLPTSDPKIQTWVQKSLYHIKQVRADVYLLWPLFITGAECGSEDEREVIRQRCLDIQKDSGFINNASCLTLLEKVWKGDSIDGGEEKVNTFRFRDVMMAEGNEGEWIVI